MSDNLERLTDGMSRRQLIQRGLIAGGALAGGGVLLSACGSSSSSVSATTTASESAPFYTGKPKYGGTLIRGVIGNGARDTLDFANANSGADVQRGLALYDRLFRTNPNYIVEPMLVDEYEVSPDAQVWTLRLREGVEFHNGKTMTPEDVIFSIQRIIDPKNPEISAGQLAAVDPNAIKTLDKRTVQFTLKFPSVAFAESLAAQAPIVPVGFDVNKPVGTGPFKFGSFTPGQQSHFPKNENYWVSGQPYLDAYTIIDFAEDQARANALISGQIHVVESLPANLRSLVSSHSDCHLLTYSSNTWECFKMRTDKGPTADPRVREAVKLIADREALVKTALSGLGRVGNDLYAPQDPDFDHKIPQREPDIEKAKSLLKAAGQEDLSLELVTAEVASGMNPSSLAFAQQAKAAGVTINVNQVETGTLYGPNYMNWQFATDVFPTYGYFVTAQQTDGPTSAANVSHFHDAEYDSLYKKAIAEPDDSKRKPMMYRMQEIQTEKGGYLIWGFLDQIDAYRNVGGLKPGLAGAATDYVAEMWLA